MAHEKGEAIMGIKALQVGAGREALEIVCDGAKHSGGPRSAWFDCGSNLGNLALAVAAGWLELSHAGKKWLCPQCAHRKTPR